MCLFCSYFICHTVFLLKESREKLPPFVTTDLAEGQVSIFWYWYFPVHAGRLHIFVQVYIVYIECILRSWSCQPLYKKSLLMWFSPFISLSKIMYISVWPFSMHLLAWECEQLGKQKSLCICLFFRGYCSVSYQSYIV